MRRQQADALHAARIAQYVGPPLAGGRLSVPFDTTLRMTQPCNDFEGHVLRLIGGRGMLYHARTVKEHMGISEAVILAGGKGTRLRDVVKDRPKPMAEVAGRPFLEWLVMSLRDEGVRRIVLCTGYMHEAVERHFGDGGAWGIEIVYSRESSPLGTAGAVRQALDKVRSDCFLALNGDSFCRIELARFLEAHLAGKARASLWLIPMDDCSRYGSVVVDADGAVVSFLEKDSTRPAGLINAGAYLLQREALADVPTGREVSMEKEVFPRLAGHGLYGVKGVGPFIDIGAPAAYAEAQNFFASGIQGRLRERIEGSENSHASNCRS